MRLNATMIFDGVADNPPTTSRFTSYERSCAILADAFLLLFKRCDAENLTILLLTTQAFEEHSV